MLLFCQQTHFKSISEVHCQQLVYWSVCPPEGKVSWSLIRIRLFLWKQQLFISKPSKATVPPLNLEQCTATAASGEVKLLLWHCLHVIDYCLNAVSMEPNSSNTEWWSNLVGSTLIKIQQSCSPRVFLGPLIVCLWLCWPRTFWSGFCITIASLIDYRSDMISQT